MRQVDRYIKRETKMVKVQNGNFPILGHAACSRLTGREENFKVRTLKAVVRYIDLEISDPDTLQNPVAGVRH